MVCNDNILGHNVSQVGISIDANNINMISKFSCLISKKGVQFFMGHCGYYCRFIYQYAKFAKPLFALRIAVEWTIKFEDAFGTLTKALVSAPTLKPLD